MIGFCVSRLNQSRLISDKRNTGGQNPGGGGGIEFSQQSTTTLLASEGLGDIGYIQSADQRASVGQIEYKISPEMTCILRSVQTLLRLGTKTPSWRMTKWMCGEICSIEEPVALEELH